MNGRRMALGLAGILALLATTLVGCVAPLEPSETVGEATEELATSSSEDESDEGAADVPADRSNPEPAGDVMPDPLPWRELIPRPSPMLRDPGEQEGPDPLPWEPGSSGDSPGTGSSSNDNE
jgi:hypothetical protein